MTKLYTIGHSNRTLADFIDLLKSYKISCVVDIRTIPKSRHVPWSNKDALIKALAKEHMHYYHMPELGGLRHAKSDSINTGWENESFRGFADYMQTTDFFAALKELNKIIKQNKNVVIVCAEAVPWRCHRSLIADAEIIRRVKVIHILSLTNIKQHELTDFAQVDRSCRPFKVFYPSIQKNFFD